ncbi:unnamed protein product [Rotaria socialis]|uniref:S-adenosyl-L-homocysteine hydrolase NAD binding domain-containing protein n=3 Tax=Rotaria socialis TaxID=392032 RepID=A0A820KIN7_9BILA|nr:unnamed protein product [Rotaria socialis]CAF4340567.1 unnamed protein product [Rotaria socialis]
MLRFDILPMGIYSSKKNVENFFEAVQNTFSPVPPVSEEHEFISNDREDRKRHATMPLLVRSSQSENNDARLVQEGSSIKNQPILVVVVHLLPTLPAYLDALQRIGDIKIIIFKGAPESDRPQHMQTMANWVSTHNNFKEAVRPQVTKESLKRTGEAIRLISDVANLNDAEVIIMDIGGYFAPCLAELGNKDSYPRLWKLLGIVEDTENGHQKYHDAKQSLPRNVTHPRIYSVARSQMKMTEDYNVGKSLVRAADTILRQTLDLRLEDHPVVGVIGFGKIGNSIAIHMRQQHIGRVMVYDVNPTIMLRAVSQDFVICSKEEMLQTASFIFCATGNKALAFNDLLHIGPSINRLIIGSCTSADDELDLHDDLKRYENSSDDRGYYSRYTIQRLDGTEVEIVLLCNGNAINFSCRAILGESIRSVQAAMMVCALNLLRSHTESKTETEILTLTNEEEMTIARLWIQHFSKLDVRLITNVDSASKLEHSSLERSRSDLPVDQTSMALLKQQLGLQRAAYTDPIDFMDSERKLIITAPRGTGKSTVVSALIQDVRNYYDLIWWFDCSDSLYGCTVHLARAFHVFSIALSPEELQKAVLKVIFSSMAVNHFLLIVDNIQDPVGEKVAAESIIDGSERIFQCHELLTALDKALSDPSVRHQRRRHLVALYTDDSVNLPPSQSYTTVAANASKGAWVYLPLQGIASETIENWVCNKLSAFSRNSVRESRRKIIHDILSVDGRRLTIQLTAVLLTSEDVTKRDIKYRLGTALSEGSDILASLVKLALDKLRTLNSLSFICAQVVSLIKSNYASREMFLRLIKILPPQEHFETDDTILTGRKPREVWEHLLSALKKFCILKKNVLLSTINVYTSGNYIPPDYLEIYNMPSTYGNALRKPLLDDTTDHVWNYVLQLVNSGFNYDYHATTERQHAPNIIHYFEHAYVLAKYTSDWDGCEDNAMLLADLLWRLGSYYLNEVRLYSKAAESFRKSYKLINKNIDSRRRIKIDDETLLSLNITKWGAKLYWHICEQLTHRIDAQEDEKLIEKMQLCQNNLMKLSDPIAKSELQRKSNYQIEAVIAIARIRVQNIRVANPQIGTTNEILETIIRNLLNILEDDSMATRTESLMLQILGSAHSQLGKHTEAVAYLRRSLEQRRKVLTSEHVDLARTEYKLAYCLVQWGEDMKKNINATDTTEFIRNMREARALCETAFKTQRTQLPSDHNNLTECNNLRHRMNELEQKWLPVDAC